MGFLESFGVGFLVMVVIALVVSAERLRVHPIVLP